MKRRHAFTEQKAVYHAASCCQAASLPLTPRHSHDWAKACSVQGKKTVHFASQAGMSLSCSWGMAVLRFLEDSCIIARLLVPHGKDDSHPHDGKSTDGFRLAFPLGSLALVVISGPGFLLGTRPARPDGEYCAEVYYRHSDDGPWSSFRSER